MGRLRRGTLHSVRDDHERLISEAVAATLSYDSAPGATPIVHSVHPPGHPAQTSGDGDELAGTSWRGRVLGDFVLGDVLGQGGGGTVYRAEQRGLGRPAV